MRTRLLRITKNATKFKIKNTELIFFIKQKICEPSRKVFLMYEKLFFNLNNILIACNISTLTEVEVEAFNSYIFDIEKDYFDAIYSLIMSRNEPTIARNRFCDYALTQGFTYIKTEMKTDTLWIVG